MVGAPELKVHPVLKYRSRVNKTVLRGGGHVSVITRKVLDLISLVFEIHTSLADLIIEALLFRPNLRSDGVYFELP